MPGTAGHKDVHLAGKRLCTTSLGFTWGKKWVLNVSISILFIWLFMWFLSLHCRNVSMQTWSLSLEQQCAYCRCSLRQSNRKYKEVYSNDYSSSKRCYYTLWNISLQNLLYSTSSINNQHFFCSTFSCRLFGMVLTFGSFVKNRLFSVVIKFSLYRPHSVHGNFILTRTPEVHLLYEEVLERIIER